MDHSLLAQSVGFRAQSEDAPDPSALLQTEPTQTEELEQWIGTLLLGFDLPSFAAHLASLKDGLPLPQTFEWQHRDSFEHLMERLPAADRRTLDVFRQIMRQERKSQRYFEAYEALRERYPAEESLAISAIAYLDRWDPQAGQVLQTELLDAHPEWLMLRFAAASHILGSLQIEEPDPTALEKVAALLQHRFELHEHLALVGRTEASEEEAFIFYYTTAVYLMLTQRFERALYALNVCTAIQGRQSVLSQTVFLFLELEKHQADQRLQAFLKPLQKGRRQTLRTSL